jgi:acyl carrier protein
VTILDSLNTIFQEELDDPKLQVTLDLTQDDLQTWDSLAHVRIIASIEERFGFQFSLSQIEESTSVRALMDVIAAGQA